MLSDLGIKYRLVPVEAPWQHGMVERHGQVLADIIHASVTEVEVVGEKDMRDITLHTTMAIADASLNAITVIFVSYCLQHYMYAFFPAM